MTRIRRKYRAVVLELDERRRRQWAAAEARDVGHGGVSLVARATGLARSTIHAGLRELRAPARARVAAAQRVRRAGGGRPAITTADPGVLAALLALIEPTTRGDPESPLRWTCKSTAQLADELRRQNHPVSARTVATLLKGAVQFASEPETARDRPPGSGRAVSVPQSWRAAGHPRRAAGDLGRHQEEGIGRELQEGGAHLATAGAARPRARA